MQALCGGLHHEVARQEDLVVRERICTVLPALAAHQGPQLGQHGRQGCQLVCWILQVDEHALTKKLSSSLCTSS